MKDIMASESSTTDQGVPSLSYSPADASMPLLFSLNTPLDRLEDMLLGDFEGQTITMERIYETHSLDRPYIRKNYRSALLSLEAKDKISVSPPLQAKSPAKGRRAGTFAGHVVVKFPLRSQ